MKKILLALFCFFVLTESLQAQIDLDGNLSDWDTTSFKYDVFTSYSSNEFGYTNTLTNLDSRYFLLQFSWRPQVWGKSKHDTGKGRRGDGSFIK